MEEVVKVRSRARTDSAEPPEKGPIRLCVVGSATPEGCETFRALSQWEKALLLLAVDQHEVGSTMRALAGGRAPNVKIEDKLGAALDREKCDVLVDFSHSSAALQHGLSAMKRGVVPILNTQLSSPEIRELVVASKQSGVPALVAPHLSAGAVIALQFCEMAARWMTEFEVIDHHPDRRLETPSPYAKAMAQSVSDGWEHRELFSADGDPAKSRTWEDVKMHLVRLRGISQRQEVQFGAAGESISLTFSYHDPAAIIEGLKLAITTVQSLKGVTVGLEKVMFAHPVPRQ